MDLRQALHRSERIMQAAKGDGQRVWMALRRSGIEDLEQLKKFYDRAPGKLEDIRGIGPKHMELIRLCMEEGNNPGPAPPE